MKQTQAINEALLVAQQIINLHRHEFIVPEHILLAFFSNENFRSAVERCADIEMMETDLTDVIMDMESVPEDMELTPEYSVQFKEMCNHAGQAAIGSGSDAIGIHHIVYGIFQLEDSQARHILESHLEVSVPDFLNALAAINEESGEPHEKWQRFLSAVEPAEVFIGREKETEQALRILCRKTKNNILIIGGNGVGKTAFAKHLSITIRKNNIIPVCEDDTRTHYGYDVKGSQRQTITEKQTIAQELRNMTIAICRNSPNYYYPLIYGTEISFPAMTGLINTLKITGQHILDNDTARNAQIALVVSEESIKAMPPVTQKVRSGIIDQYYKGNGNVAKRERIRPVLTFESFIGNQGRFNRSGAPVDQLLAEDLADNPGNYKLYVFINCFKYDDKFLAAVKKLQQRDCVLLWLYAPGYIKGVNSSTANMKELTGLDFSRIDNGIPAAVIRNDGSLLGTPAANVTPMFAVNTPGVEVLGKYNNGQTTSTMTITPAASVLAASNAARCATVSS